MPSRRRIVEAVNKLSMTEHETILSLLRLGWSERRIAREGGHHRATIRRIRREAGLLPAKCTTPIEVPTDPVAPEPQRVPGGATAAHGPGACGARPVCCRQSVPPRSKCPPPR